MIPFDIDPETVRRAEAAYEGAFMSRLQLELPFTRKAKPDAVKLHLQQSGALYLWMRAGQAERPAVHAQWRVRKAQIQAVEYAAQQLQGAMQGLDEEAAAFSCQDLRRDELMQMSRHPEVFGDTVIHSNRGLAAPVFLLTRTI